MRRPAYYNEIDPYCARWLRNLIAAGHLPPGDVDERDIRDVAADDLRGYGQIHLFAGIGGFGLAARLAALPDDFPVLTGGFPCQPFSCAGERRGVSDDRHLWPEMRRLVAALRPAWVLGENVAGLVGLALDGVLSDLEGEGYACWPAVIPACAVDAPHRRDRVWIVGHAQRSRADVLAARSRSRGAACESGPRSDVADTRCAWPAQPEGCVEEQRRRSLDGGQGDVEHAPQHGRREGRPEPGVRSGRPATAEPGGADPVGDALGAGLAQRQGGRGDDGAERASAERAGRDAWAGAGWIVGADGKARRVPEPGICGLADGLRPGLDGPRAEGEAAASIPLLVQRHEYDYSAGARIARLRALGNAIVPQVAAEILGAMRRADLAAAGEVAS